MAKLQNYRFAGDVVTGGQTSHLAGEFQAPDRIHETVTLPNGAIELVMIGDRAYRRTAPDGAWQQVAGATTGDPRTAFKTLTSAATVVASGTDGYIFTLSGEAARSLAGTTDRLEGTAGLSGRYITDLHYKTSAGSPVDVHLTYQDFDRAPPVTAPA